MTEAVSTEEGIYPVKMEVLKIFASPPHTPPTKPPPVEMPESDLWQKVREWQEKSAIQLDSQASTLTSNNDETNKFQLNVCGQHSNLGNDSLVPSLECNGISDVMDTPNLPTSTEGNLVAVDNIECSFPSMECNVTIDTTENTSVVKSSVADGKGGGGGEGGMGEKNGRNENENKNEMGEMGLKMDEGVSEKKDGGMKEGDDKVVKCPTEDSGDEVFKKLYPVPVKSSGSSIVCKSTEPTDTDSKPSGKMTWNDFNWKVLKDSFS